MPHAIACMRPFLFQFLLHGVLVGRASPAVAEMGSVVQPRAESAFAVDVRPVRAMAGSQPGLTGARGSNLPPLEEKFSLSKSQHRKTLQVPSPWPDQDEREHGVGRSKRRF